MLINARAMPVLDLCSSLRFGGLGTGAKLEKDNVCWIVPGRFLIIPDSLPTITYFPFLDDIIFIGLIITMLNIFEKDRHVGSLPGVIPYPPPSRNLNIFWLNCLVLAITDGSYLIG